MNYVRYIVVIYGKICQAGQGIRCLLGPACLGVNTVSEFSSFLFNRFRESKGCTVTVWQLQMMNRLT